MEIISKRFIHQIDMLLTAIATPMKRMKCEKITSSFSLNSFHKPTPSAIPAPSGMTSVVVAIAILDLAYRFMTFKSTSMPTMKRKRIIPRVPIRLRYGRESSGKMSSM